MENQDVFPGEQPAIPSGLKVLTVLTFIGCGVGALLLFAIRPLYSFLLKMIEQAESSGKEFSAKELDDMRKGKEAMNNVLANLTPILITGFIGIILCFIGALWMRKLKKDGFWLYTAGELMPSIASIVILGTSQLQGGMAIFMSLILPVLFVVLYAFQRKHLVN